jgi:hypothetical protein
VTGAVVAVGLVADEDVVVVVVVVVVDPLSIETVVAVWPASEAAATTPTPATAATPAIALPMVRVRSRPRARSRSVGPWRAVVSMARSVGPGTFQADYAPGGRRRGTGPPAVTIRKGTAGQSRGGRRARILIPDRVDRRPRR